MTPCRLTRTWALQMPRSRDRQQRSQTTHGSSPCTSSLMPQRQQQQQHQRLKGKQQQQQRQHNLTQAARQGNTFTRAGISRSASSRHAAVYSLYLDPRP